MRLLPLVLLLSAAPVMVLAADVIPVAKDGMTYARHLAAVAVKAHAGVKGVVLRTDEPAGTAGASPATPAAGDTVHEALLNVSGDKLGTIDVTFAKPGDHSKAVADIKAYVAKRALSAKNLYDPYPYDPAFRPDTEAQALVDQTMKAHPELLVFAIHATPPHKKINVIIGSNIGRIGKQADEDDLRVIEKGSTNLEISEGGKRFEVELPLNDAKGHRIGALGTVWPYHDGVDKKALEAAAIKIRDALARKIPTSAALFKTHR